MKIDELIPNIVADSISDIDIEFLKREGITTVFLDMDNTIAPWNSAVLALNVLTWVEKAKQAGLSLYIVTNGRKSRVEGVAKTLDIGFFESAAKPRRKAMLKILKTAGVTAEETIMVGDQLFTDILAANRVGIKSVFVWPISPKEWWVTKVFNRTRERLVWKKVFGNKKPKDKQGQLDK